MNAQGGDGPVRLPPWPVLVLAFAIAGCADGPALEGPQDPGTGTTGPQPSWEWTAPAPVNAGGNGFEPSLRVGPDGTLYVAAARGFFADASGAASHVWRSPDGGATWTALASPGGLRQAVKGVEGDLAVDADGTVFFVDTYAADSTITAWDADGTWRSTRPLHGTLGLDDRPWLAAHGDGVLYAVGNSLAALPSPQAPLDLGKAARIALYASTDAGATWTLGSTFPGANYCHVAASSADDRSLAVACVPQGPGGDVGEAPNAAGAALWWSDDRGASWRRQDVAPAGDLGVPGFPSVAFDARGRWCAAWGETAPAGDVLRLACKETGGREAVVQDVHAGGILSEPWVAVAPAGAVAVVAYERASGGPWAVVAHLSLDPFTHAAWHREVLDGEAHAGDRAPPDFFQAAFAPDGALHAAYARDPSSATLAGTKADNAVVAHVRQSAGPTLSRPA